MVSLVLREYFSLRPEVSEIVLGEGLVEIQGFDLFDDEALGGGGERGFVVLGEFGVDAGEEFGEEFWGEGGGGGELRGGGM